jgi:uncharacterized protein (DUF58 family)
MSTPLAIDSRLLASVEDLPLLAQTVVEGFLDGLHRSPFLGYSTEFASYRQYVQGDNLRHLDWKVWARSDALYVKQFEDDTNYRGQIYLDTSASMDFGTGPANKFTYGRLLAAALTHLMILQRDAPGLVLFGPDSRQALPCAASRNQAMELFAALARAQAGGKTVIGQDLFGIVQAVVRRGISVVISDFFTTDDSGFELLRQLHAHRQETLVFHLLSPEELELPETGEWILEDSETGEERIVHLDEVRTSYRERLNTFCDRVKTECQSYEFDYVRLSTGEPLDQALMNYLERRSHL